jgi:hypothetical protein
MPMQSTYFSTKERTGRGDTSAWTDNPQEKAKKAQQQCVFKIDSHFLTLVSNLTRVEDDSLL